MQTPRLWTALVAMSFIVFALATTEILVSHHEAIENGYEKVSMINLSLQERIVRIFDSTEETLTDFSSGIESLSAKNEKEYHLQFRSHLTRMPYVNAFYLTDRFGNMIANSTEYPTRKRTLKERPHIRFHLENPESTTFVGEVTQSLVNGKMFIPITKKIFDRHGQFVGIIGAAISPQAIQKFSQELGIPDGYTTYLYRKNGSVMGASVENPPEVDFEKLKENSHGTFRDRSSDHQYRFVAYSWIPNRPLLAATTLPEKVILGSWTVDSSLKFLVLSLTILGLVGTMFYFRYQYRSQSQEIQKSSQNYQLLTSLLEKSSDKVGLAYCESISRLIADFLGVDQVFVGEISNSSSRKIRTISYIVGGKFQKEMEYSIDATPCERVLNGENGVYPDHLQQIFPQDLILRDLGLHSYVGVPLRNAGGVTIGLFSILDTKPMPEAINHQALLSIFAHRLTVELDRLRNDWALKSNSKPVSRSA